jgi:alcohol dehydrogenase class IV
LAFEFCFVFAVFEMEFQALVGGGGGSVEDFAKGFFSLLSSLSRGPEIDKLFLWKERA